MRNSNSKSVSLHAHRYSTDRPDGQTARYRHGLPTILVLLALVVRLHKRTRLVLAHQALAMASMVSACNVVQQSAERTACRLAAHSDGRPLTSLAACSIFLTFFLPISIGSWAAPCLVTRPGRVCVTSLIRFSSLRLVFSSILALDACVDTCASAAARIASLADGPVSSLWDTDRSVASLMRSSSEPMCEFRSSTTEAASMLCTCLVTWRRRRPSRS
ncbi:hypothetical protein BC831DRAFT_463366 [Entophlyctis helioformis]|nr:hypothetical protein BC831DRAFT_463366 [Entophlyctis helioformis]